MKKIIKKGLEKLPLVYQLAEAQEIKPSINNKKKPSVRPNRFIKIDNYNSGKTIAFYPSKPISKIV